MEWFEAVRIGFVVVGVLAFSISGALLAAEKRMDVVGLAALAIITATGGGVIRDLLIGAVPPAVLVDTWMLGVALVGAISVFFFARFVSKFSRAVLVFDAIGLGLFCVEATWKALDFGLSPIAAALVGTLTGVGGGVLRDVLANDVPAVFRRESRLYLVPALVGSAVAAWLDSIGVTGPIVLTAVAVAITVARIMAERFRWRAPAPKTELLTSIEPDERR